MLFSFAMGIFNVVVICKNKLKTPEPKALHKNMRIYTTISSLTHVGMYGVHNSLCFLSKQIKLINKSRRTQIGLWSIRFNQSDLLDSNQRPKVAHTSTIVLRSTNLAKVGKLNILVFFHSLVYVQRISSLNLVFSWKANCKLQCE